MDGTCSGQYSTVVDVDKIIKSMYILLSQRLLHTHLGTLAGPSSTCTGEVVSDRAILVLSFFMQDIRVIATDRSSTDCSALNRNVLQCAVCCQL